jgi:hypothetical protein
MQKHMVGGYCSTSEGLEFASRSLEGDYYFLELQTDRRKPTTFFSLAITCI